MWCAASILLSEPDVFFNGNVGPDSTLGTSMTDQLLEKVCRGRLAILSSIYLGNVK